MTNVLERPSSSISTEVQPLQKKGCNWDESMIEEDELMEAMVSDKMGDGKLGPKIGGGTMGLVHMLHLRLQTSCWVT
ncbi:hypothetical protein V6N13_074500 [Hibiscus sabdariffa]